jgi:hypothetical protein
VVGHLLEHRLGGRLGAHEHPFCEASPAKPACGGALRRSNCATPTPSKWPAKGVPLFVIQRR